MPAPLSERLAVCSWSLQPTSADDLFEKLAATGISRLQIALDPIRENVGGAWKDFHRRCAAQGVTCVSGMFATRGEDYSTLESIRRTGGVVPDEHWSENWSRIQADAELAHRLGLKFVTFHAGFLPEHESDPAYARLLARIHQIADLFAARGLVLGFETGQETGETIKGFLRQLKSPNVGVNFDPANMLLYDQGDPVQTLRALGPWLRQCHVKDARRTKVTGTWGEEVVVGTGEVDWKDFFRTLAELRFAGPLCLEREAGNSRVADIRAARDLIGQLTA